MKLSILALMAFTSAAELVYSYISPPQTKMVLYEDKSRNDNNLPENDFKTFLTWQTEILSYSDGTKKNYFLGQVEIKNLHTKDMEGRDDFKRDEIRVTIGIRNPMDDAYDLTGIDIRYDRRPDKIDFKCHDGYANGTISTEKHFRGSPRGQRYDQLGFHNITIEEWSRHKRPSGNTVYRVPEINDCKIISGTATGRQDFGDTNIPGTPNEGVKQDFTIKYRKPMVTKDVNDFDLVPGKTYDVTAFLACYRDDGQNNRYQSDNDGFQFWRGNWGCRAFRTGKRGGELIHAVWENNEVQSRTKGLSEYEYLPQDVQITLYKAGSMISVAVATLLAVTLAV